MNDAERYAGADSVQTRDVRHFLSENIEYFKWTSGDVVLDIGCGPGDVTANVLLPKLPDNIGHLVGCDISKSMVKHATDNFAQPKLSFTQLDIGAQTLDLPELKSLVGFKESKGRENDGVFDKIFSFFCLHWVVDQTQAMKNVYDLMKPRGEGLVSLVAKCPIFELREFMSRKTQWQPYMKDVSHFGSPYHYSLDPRLEFADLLQEAGFHVIRCRTETRSFQFGTRNLLKKFIISLNPFGVRVPNNVLEEYLKDCILEIINGKITRIVYSKNDTSNGEETFVMTYELLMAHFTQCNK